MVLVQNTSDKDFRIVFQTVEYQIPIGEPVDIPEIAASLYFAYGIENPNLENIKWCCHRLKRANPALANMPNREIWDNIICKVIFGKDIIKKSKR